MSCSGRFYICGVKELVIHFFLATKAVADMMSCSGRFYACGVKELVMHFSSATKAVADTMSSSASSQIF